MLHGAIHHVTQDVDLMVQDSRVNRERIVTALVEHFGWAELGQRIEIKCFRIDPSVASSLKFLRKTPWARAKVESLYLFMLREQRRAGGN